MKKSFALILTLLLAFGLAACGGSAPKEIKDKDSEQQAEAPEKATIESQVLVDQDGLVITAQELVEDEIWGMGVKVLIENNTDQNVCVQCNSIIVNNYMVFDLFSCEVAPGKKANDTIYLSSSSLEEAGITTISDIIVSFHVFDSNGFDTLFDTPEIEIQTSAYGTVQQPAMDDGVELVNQDGIRIVGKYVDEERLMGASVLLFMENNTGRNILIQCDDMSVNGFMVTGFLYSAVNSGRMALDDITILSSDLEENGIESIEDIELIFQVIDSDTFDTILETGPVSFTVQ